MTACVQLTVEQSRAVQSCSEQKGSRGTMLRFGVRAVCWGSWSVESLRLVTDGVPSLGSARRGVAIDETVLAWSVVVVRRVVPPTWLARGCCGGGYF
jgi:hypothetical protein